MGLSDVEDAFSPQRLGLARSVTPGYVASGVALEVPWSNQNYVVFAYPDPAFHFAADSAEPFFAVLALYHDAVEAKQFGDYAQQFALSGVNHFVEVAFV